MSRPRDNQRKRLYDAENAAQRECAPQTFWKQTIPNDQLQGWVNRVLGRASVFDRWPGKRITVQLGRNGAHADHHGNVITMGVQTRNPWVLLHEMAHCLAPSDVPSHGPEYAGVYAFLVKTVLGKEAHAVLLKHYRVKRVRKSTKAIPKPNPQRRHAKVTYIARQKTKAPSSLALREAAAVIRQAAKAGMLGEATRKPRVHALATARLLEAAVPQPVAAKRGQR